MSFAANKEQKTKAKHDKELKAQIEKEREQQMLLEIERTEKERSKKKGTAHHSALSLWSLNLGVKILKSCGILGAYECTCTASSSISYLSRLDLLDSLCKYGLPTGDIFEFAALTVLKYEKRYKT